MWFAVSSQPIIAEGFSPGTRRFVAKRRKLINQRYSATPSVCFWAVVMLRNAAEKAHREESEAAIREKRRRNAGGMPKFGTHGISRGRDAAWHRTTLAHLTNGEFVGGWKCQKKGSAECAYKVFRCNKKSIKRFIAFEWAQNRGNAEICFC